MIDLLTPVKNPGACDRNGVVDLPFTPRLLEESVEPSPSIDKIPPPRSAACRSASTAESDNTSLVIPKLKPPSYSIESGSSAAARLGLEATG